MKPSIRVMDTYEIRAEILAHKYSVFDYLLIADIFLGKVLGWFPFPFKGLED